MSSWTQKLFTLLLLPIFLEGCEKSSSKARPVDATSIEPQAQSEESAPIPFVEVKKRLYMDKDEAIQDFKEALSALDLKIDRLEKNISQSNSEISHNVKEAWKEDAENLRLQRDKLYHEFKRLEDATAESWEKAQSSFCDRWAALEERWDGKQAE